MRLKSGSTNIRTRPISTIRAFSTPRIWSRRSRIDVAARYILAEIRDAGADGAGDRGAVRLCRGPVADQRNSVQQPRGRRAAGVSRLHRSGVSESKILRARFRSDQKGQPRPAGPVRKLRVLLPLCLRGSKGCFRRPAGMACLMRLRFEAAFAVSLREKPGRT